MKDKQNAQEIITDCFSYFFLFPSCFFNDCDEDGSQLVTLLPESFEFLVCDDPTLDNKFEPVGGFFNFTAGYRRIWQ